MCVTDHIACVRERKHPDCSVSHSRPISFLCGRAFTSSLLDRETMAQSQTVPYPLALSTPPPFVHSRGGSATLRAVPNQVVLSVSELLHPEVVSLHQCKLMAVVARSATGKWTRKQHTNESSVLLDCPVAYFTRKFVTPTNKITIRVEIQRCCSSDRQLI